jgi:hypothetical protein
MVQDVSVVMSGATTMSLLLLLLVAGCKVLQLLSLKSQISIHIAGARKVRRTDEESETRVKSGIQMLPAANRY